jgi:hypothetical protein
VSNEALKAEIDALKARAVEEREREAKEGERRMQEQMEVCYAIKPCPNLSQMLSFYGIYHYIYGRGGCRSRWRYAML